MNHHDLTYDWNAHDNFSFKKNVEICDETLRDGLQSPSIKDPNINEKYELLLLMSELGITIADIGLPAAGPRAYEDVLKLAQFANEQRLSIKLSCAARTILKDIKPIAEIQHKVGIPITVYCFLGTSPVRQLVEDWDINKLRTTSQEAIEFAIKENLNVAFVTEDTTRSSPKTLEVLLKHAIELGASRLVLCDTVGHVTPNGIKALIAFTKKLINDSKAQVFIDWHGHNDRGLGVSNALFAAEYGCERIHGTALGIGERVGNTAIDQLLVNLKLLGSYAHALDSLTLYLEKSAQAYGQTIPYNYPVFGKDAFRTATGVHAAAVIKALKTGDPVLADLIYSGVPANWFGKKQVIDIGPMSGASNIRFWLKSHGLDEDEVIISELLQHAKSLSHVLTDQEIEQFIDKLSKT